MPCTKGISSFASKDGRQLNQPALLSLLSRLSQALVSELSLAKPLLVPRSSRSSSLSSQEDARPLQSMVCTGRLERDVQAKGGGATTTLAERDGTHCRLQVTAGQATWLWWPYVQTQTCVPLGHAVAHLPGALVCLAAPLVCRAAGILSLTPQPCVAPGSSAHLV